MRKLLLALLTVIVIPSGMLAQTAEQHRGQGYVFFAPGGLSAFGTTTTTVHFGGGGELLVYKGLGVGGEVGYLTPTQSFSDGLGTLSLNGSYHLLPYKGEGKVALFVTAGYSLFFRSGTANLLNVGGGLNYWFTKRVGLRVEVRDHIWPNRGGESTAHFWGVRVGIALR